MKVVVIGSYPLNVSCIQGGVEASVFGLVQELSNHNEVIIYDIPRIGGEDSEHIEGKLKIVRTSNPGKWNLSANVLLVEGFCEQILKNEPDVCHIHGTAPFMYGVYKRLKKQKVPILVTVHGLIHVEKRNELKKKFSLNTMFRYLYQSRIEYKMLSKCSHIVVDTEYVRRAILECVQKGKIKNLPAVFVIPQGVNVKYFGLDCSKETSSVLSVGTFSSRKGHLYLVKSFEKLAESNKDTFLTIAGAKSSEKYFEMVEDYISRSAFRDRIRLLPNVSREDLFCQYQQAHIFALHSEEESQGIVLAEAMAVGLPVVATRIGGIPDVVKDGESGILVDFSDTETFANALQTLLTDNEKWEFMSGKGKQLSLRYKWSNICREIEKLYANLISE